MDTIRTCYIDAANAVERNGSYVYDLQGGIAVPEGARVFIDNVSFQNQFSEEVSEENQFAYLQTFESDSVKDLSDESFVFSYAGDPKKDLLHSDQVTALQGILRSNLTSTQWTDGTGVYNAHVVQTPSENAPDQFQLDIGGTMRKLFIYDVTQDRFYFHANFPTGTAVTSGVYNNGALHLGAQQLAPTNANAPVVAQTPKIPV